MNSTIFAQSTGRGKAGVAVIRISGPEALPILYKLLKEKEEILPNTIYLRKLYNKDNLVIDHAMVIYFKAPRSFTGEDVVELHTHGSIAVIRMLYEELLNLNIYIAEPGEFAKRAFLNGKMDLTAAEGLADLINAETLIQQKHAMRHMHGEFEALCLSWKEQLLKALALIEAYIDFPEEEIPESVLNNTEMLIRQLKDSLTQKIQDSRKGQRLRDGIVMTIIGPANVGKSSLLNYLSQKDVAIISDIPGTTRDIIETHIDLGGYPIILSDTAGIREDTEDIIEKEGIARALKAAQNADIKILMLDARERTNIPAELEKIIDPDTIIIFNKADLIKIENTSSKHLFISIKENYGLDRLIHSIIDKASHLVTSGDNVEITRERHKFHLTKSLEILNQCNLRGDLVLAAEDLRLAARNLMILTGKIEVEEILGEIFSNFCIGK